MTFDKIIIESKHLINVYKNKTTLLLLTIIPFMLLFIMTFCFNSFFTSHLLFKTNS